MPKWITMDFGRRERKIEREGEERDKQEWNNEEKTKTSREPKLRRRIRM